MGALEAGGDNRPNAALVPGLIVQDVITLCPMLACLPVITLDVLGLTGEGVALAGALGRGLDSGWFADGGLVEVVVWSLAEQEHILMGLSATILDRLDEFSWGDFQA